MPITEIIIDERTSTMPEQVHRLVSRFGGIDIQCRNAWESIGWKGRWRAKNVTMKNERDDYRLTAFGSTPDEAIQRLIDAVERVDKLNQ